MPQTPYSGASLLIFPFNGNGLEALDCLGDAYRFVGFVDDSPEKRKESRGFPVFDRGAFEKFPDAHVLAAPGSPTSFRARRQTISDLGLPDERFARVIHPMARISPLAKIGLNALVMAGVVVTSNCSIGDHVCILPNSVLHHDTKIGDYCLVGSNVTIAGGVTLADNCYVGSGCSIINGATIGAGAMLGIGSNVIHDVAPGVVVVGNPARPVSQQPRAEE
ncbi:acetyltransferase [Methylocystis sp.]|uniref:acetyltransferase n=1 Tax=Methylocystis sp. TaxID=1911079 RepID=UPI003964852C